LKTESLGKSYRPWLIACLILLVGSLLVLAAAAAGAFVWFSETGAPVWLVVVGVLAVLGVAAGFAGLIVLLATAGWKSFREEKAVSVEVPTAPSIADSENV
jgi:hypothetical protein